MALLELPVQERKLTMHMAQVKKAMKERPYFEGSLDPNNYLKWV